ncbi:MAG: hypothetical protein R3236_04920, partial [Phycisphaeraceae bacterium]|nr:hypothetical protein [Phycisphaeraceae bacterium]
RPRCGEAYLAGAEAELQLGRTTAALRRFNWVAANENNGRPLVQIRAAMGVGRCLEAMDRHAAAHRAYLFARHNLEAIQRSGRLAHPWLVRRLRKRIEISGRRAAETSPEREATPKPQEAGPAFGLYHRAQKLRLENQSPRAALALYRRIMRDHPRTIYAEASALYGPVCLADAGRPTAARNEWIAALGRSPRGGPYFGEIMLRLGMLALEQAQDSHEAARWFVSLDRWIADQRRETQKKAAGYRGVRPEALRWVRPSPQRPTMGDLAARFASPGHLLHPETAAWYLDDLESRCAIFRGFCLALRDRRNEAMHHYRRLLKLDDRLRDGHPLAEANLFTRLKFSAETGRMICKPEELAGYRPAQQQALRLGDLYYISGQYRSCLRIHRRLEKVPSVRSTHGKRI